MKISIYLMAIFAIFPIITTSAIDTKNQEALTTAGLPEPTELKNLPPGKTGEMIIYGQDLLANTADWFGPKGKLNHSNKSRMSCRNCHLDVGRQEFGNSLFDAQGLYPQYRAREGKVQTLADRVNACITRPIQGKPLAQDSKEMQSILLYMKFINRGHMPLDTDPDERMMKLQLLERAASPEKGSAIYTNRCAHCHGKDGLGKLRSDGVAFVFPPLWGPESFVNGSSMSRLSLMARFVKGNMPLGATAQSPLLSDEEAWDVASYVLKQKRPQWNGKKTFVSLKEKPFDYPIGPYEDSFSTEQHLLGPFKPIIDYWTEQIKTQRVNSIGI